MWKQQVQGTFNMDAVKQTPPQLQAAVKAMERSALISAELRPYAQPLEFLDRELQRVHGLISAKINGRESHYDDDKTLLKFQAELLLAVNDFKNARELATVGPAPTRQTSFNEDRGADEIPF